MTNTVGNTVSQVESTIAGAPGKTQADEVANGIVNGVPGAPVKPRATEATNGAGHGKPGAAEVANGVVNGVAGPESPVGHAVDETVRAVGDLLNPHH